MKETPALNFPVVFKWNKLDKPNWGQNVKSRLEIGAVLHCLRLTSRANACLTQFNFWEVLIKFKNSNGKNAITCHSAMIELPVSLCKCVTTKRFHYLYNSTTSFTGYLQDKVFSSKGCVARGWPARDTQADTLGEAQAWFWHTFWPNQPWSAIAWGKQLPRNRLSHGDSLR